MEVPERIAGLKWLTVITGLYGLVWISLEGALWQVILLAAGVTLLGLLYLLQRLSGGRQITPGRWLILCAGLGAMAGLACALLTLVLMAVKTGLHGHGPEFTAAEIEWVIKQIPLWAAAGLVAGLGAGTLGLACKRPQQRR